MSVFLIALHSQTDFGLLCGCSQLGEAALMSHFPGSYCLLTVHLVQHSSHGTDCLIFFRTVSFFFFLL